MQVMVLLKVYKVKNVLLVNQSRQVSFKLIEISMEIYFIYENFKAFQYQVISYDEHLRKSIFL